MTTAIIDNETMKRDEEWGHSWPSRDRNELLRSLAIWRTRWVCASE